jgi:DNA-binding MarR family transcriptional regulator
MRDTKFHNFIILTIIMPASHDSVAETRPSFRNEILRLESGMKQNQIDLVRRFNRAITQRIGALDDAYLSRGRSLGLSRLLWEIGPAGCEVKLLRACLGLDSGYLSRQLRRLEADRLVIADPDDGDGRVRKVRLTRKGLAERAVLDGSSNELAASILTPLTELQ